MRYLTDGKKKVVFLCDRFGKVLTGEDPGEVNIPDMDRLTEDIDECQNDPGQCKIICRACYLKERAP